MQQYVVGVIFDETYDNVLLIRKRRPELQIGKLNGVGGKIEVDETPYAAMIRECEEECGLLLYNWLLVDNFTDNVNFNVHFFTIQTTAIQKAVSKTDEQVEIWPLYELCFSDIVSPTDDVIRLYYNNDLKENLYGDTRDKVYSTMS